MTTAQLRKNLKEYLDQADQGETLILTRAGKAYQIKSIST